MGPVGSRDRRFGGVRPKIRLEMSLFMGRLGVLALRLSFRTGGPPDVERLVTAGMLREDFEGLEVGGRQLGPCGEVLLCRELQREVVEGTYHTAGGSAVVQFLGRAPDGAARYRRRGGARVGGEGRRRGVDQVVSDAQAVWSLETTDRFLSLAGHALHHTVQARAASRARGAVEASLERGQCRYCWLPAVGRPKGPTRPHARRGASVRPRRLSGTLARHTLLGMASGGGALAPLGAAVPSAGVHALLQQRQAAGTAPRRPPGHCQASVLGGDFFVFGAGPSATKSRCERRCLRCPRSGRSCSRC